MQLISERHMLHAGGLMERPLEKPQACASIKTLRPLSWIQPVSQFDAQLAPGMLLHTVGQLKSSIC